MPTSSYSGFRILMAIVGITLLLLYLGFAYVIYRLGIFLWSIRPSFWTTVWAIIVTALIIGFLSYKFGTVRLLHRLRARELPQSRAPHLYKRLESLTSEMEISTPRLFVANLAEPNAFSLGGRKNGVIILDRSLFRLLHKNELEGIIAHELAHLESRDALLQTLAFSFLRTIVSVIFLILLPVLIVLSGISQGIAWIRGNPWAGSETIVDKTRQYIEQAVMLIFILLTMVILAQSRRREYAADDRAAEVTDKPQALAKALQKIKRASQSGWGLLSPLYIHSEKRDKLEQLLSTHPAIEDRIERLLNYTYGT